MEIIWKANPSIIIMVYGSTSICSRVPHNLDSTLLLVTLTHAKDMRIQNITKNAALVILIFLFVY